MDIQVEALLKSNLDYNESKTKYEKEIDQLEHQKLLFEQQLPVHYLYFNNIIYGFAKTLDESNKETNVYKLILITDSYENTIFFTYESPSSNKITNILDSAEQKTILSYSDSTGLLSEIIDAKNKHILFNYNNDLLLSIAKKDTETTISYENSEIKYILNNSALGALFSYKNGKVWKIEQLSLIDKIEHNNIIYKTNYASIEDCIVQNKSIMFDYKNLNSTSITNHNNKIVTYIFDKYGRVTTIYDNSFKPKESGSCEDEAVIDSVVREFSYKDNKVNIKVEKYPYSMNYLADASFDALSVTQVCEQTTKLNYENLYLSDDLFCGTNSIPYSYLVYHNHFTFSANKSIAEMTVSNKMLKSLNEENCHNLLILSCWAKADSAFIISDEDVSEYPQYIQDRKFEIRAEIKYKNNTTIISKSFDWRNSDWQYCSLPIFISSEESIESINCYIDYSNNIGNIEFTNLELKLGDYEIIDYNSLGFPVKIEKGHSEWIKKYYYNDDNLVTKEVIERKKYRDDCKNSFETTFEYNKNNKLFRSIDYNGVVKEEVYDDKGFVIKTLTYNIKEPGNVFYEEIIKNEKGEPTCEVNDFSETVAEYEYIKNTNIIKNQRDSKGSLTSFGYDNCDNLTQMTTTIDGENNTTIFGYTLDFLTSLKHNNFEINYNYDEQGRNTKVVIEGITYLTKNHSEHEETVELGTGEIFRYIKDNDEKILQVYYRKKATDNEELVMQNVYDIYGNLVYCDDQLSNTMYKYSIDQFGNLNKEETNQHECSIIINNEFDNNHKNIETTFINFNGDLFNQTLEYNYMYTKDPDSKIESITLPNKSIQKVTYDKLGRTNKITNGCLCKEFSYLSNGDHTSNLISKLSFADNNIINDKITYKYDEKGNILEIRNLNKLLTRYKYDSLSRIIREDNKVFDKTMTYSYDSGGNIIQRKEYSFSLDNELLDQQPSIFNYSYPISGWRDQLKVYNNQKFEYDLFGNPTLYRDVALSWNYGRQLSKFGNIAEFTYNAKGIRTSKISNGFTTKFYLSDTKIIRQHDASNEILFYYGADGLTSFNLNGVDYFYKKNTQNDIIGIYAADGTQIVKYFYDSWGNQKIQYLDEKNEFVDIPSDFKYNDTSIINRFVAFKNPFRYRSYYYDFETNLYYLNSRYYDSEIGRFINADDINVLDSTKNFYNGLNLYAYCLNNPVNDCDANGNISWIVGLIIAIFALGVINTAAQLISDVANYVSTGQWNSGWEDYVGALFGGMLGGVVFFFTQGNLSLTFGVMSFTESLTTNLLTNATGKTSYNIFEIAGYAVLSFALSFAMGKIFGYKNKLTTGANSFIAVFKSGLTKLYNGSVGRMSMKVFAKGVAALFTLKYKGAIGSGIFSGIKDWIMYFITGRSENLGYV